MRLRLPKIDGIVEFGGTVRGKRSLVLKIRTRALRKSISFRSPSTSSYSEGDYVKKGQQLTERPHCAARDFGSVRSAGVAGAPGERSAGGVSAPGRGDHDKHIEIIVRQMLRKVKITDPGDYLACSGEIRSINSTSRKRTRKS